MHRIAPLLSLVALALAIGYVELRMPPAAAPAPAPVPATDLSPLDRRLASLEAQVAAFAAGLDSARAAPAPAAQGDARSPAPGGPGHLPPPGTATERAAQVDALLALLEDGRLGADQVNGLWDLLPGSGREDAAIAALREYAAAHPDDPDAQYSVGISLISKLLGGKVSFMEQGTLSSQADAAFGQALALDENHFGARYSRAVSYTFWPEALGKGPDAIRNFEILRERHRGDSGNPLMESVYANLAVQYRKSGNAGKAAEVLQEALAAFPDSEALKKLSEDFSR